MKHRRQQDELAKADCPIFTDRLTRELYATDASIYRIEPKAVAFPRDADQAASAIRAAGQVGLAVIPRGAGTGLVGGAIGDGMILECARYNRQISNLDLENQTVRAGAGVVLDQLNRFLKPHGFCFGPDVATGSRATIGGMIANNSSGAHVPVYGTTADHLARLEIVLADGRAEVLALDEDSLRDQRTLVARLVKDHAAAIDERMPADLLKRWPGYALDRCKRRPADLIQLLAGSEGTLAAIMSADLKIVPLPKQKGLGLIFFSTVAEAMQATVELLDLKPAAIEHIDRVLFEQTKGQLPFKPARDLLQLDSKPCESILIVEFYDDVRDRLEALARRRLGSRRTMLTEPGEMELVWALRKAGLSLLTGRKGPAKPVTGIEDTAVRPRQLPEYVAALQEIFTRLELQACFYGHAAAGLLHVRPVLDLHSAPDLVRFRQVANDVSALVRQFNGSLAAEHGVGIARAEFMSEQLGEELLGAMRKIKESFDPQNRLNPGKIFGESDYKIDTHLRVGAGYALKLPFPPVLAFSARDHSFVANLEQCNGCGGCRKETPTMCPTFLATGDELMSTRGRANLIRAALERRGSWQGDPLHSPFLEPALSNCLACKACTTECPSNVNLSLLKAELLYARHFRYGLSGRERMLSHVDRLGRLGCSMPRLANRALRSAWFRRWLSEHFGISTRRPLPAFTSERFDTWFYRPRRIGPVSRGPVILWDDTFVRYYEPDVGRAAVAVLEAAGFEVFLARGRRCCGRPAFSQGNLAEVRRLGEHNLSVLHRLLRSRKTRSSRSHVGAAPRFHPERVPVLFLEPSCYSMFVDDYQEMKLPGTDAIAPHCLLFEQFIERLLEVEPDALRFNPLPANISIHRHCHAKALLASESDLRLAGRLTWGAAQVLDTGCCGMAGAFGALEEKYDLSVQVAQPLLNVLQSHPEGTRLVACGTSCRQQITHLSSARPLHMAQLLAEALITRSHVALT